MISENQYQCGRCDHIWTRQIRSNATQSPLHPPRQCPVCRSTRVISLTVHNLTQSSLPIVPRGTIPGINK